MQRSNQPIIIYAICLYTISFSLSAQTNPGKQQSPQKTETIQPIHKTSLDNDGKCRTRKQGGNPRQIGNHFAFDGSQDGNRQVDPQIAVGGNHLFHGTNNGLIVYTKKGEFVNGVSQACFNGGIDPKIFFDVHNRVFAFDLWNPWDREKLKPVNISVSETDDPTGAWNIYPVPAPQGVDGGAIGYSKQLIGYSFPGGPTQTFVLKMNFAKAGKPVKVFYFEGNLGDPVQTLDPIDELYFIKVTRQDFILTKVFFDDSPTPVAQEVARKPHGLQYWNWPPQSPQKGTDVKVASGDRRPKNMYLYHDCLWFSHTVNCNGRAAVQWHQIKLDGTIVQTGLIASENSNYIQSTLAVNKHKDVLIGFQEVNENMFVSPRMAFHHHADKPGSIRKIVSLGEGRGATDGVAWGDYSGTVVDSDNMTDLWTIQSIANEKGRGETVIVKYGMED